MDKRAEKADGYTETLKSRGIIKAHGVSIHSFEALEAAAASSWIDVIHVRINPFGAAMDSGDPAQVTPVIEKMHKSGKGIIGMKLVGGGNFRNDMRLILLFPMLLFLFSLPLTGQDDGLAKLVKRGAQLEKPADGFQFTEGPSSDPQGHRGIMLICHRKNNVYITLNLIIKL